MSTNGLPNDGPDRTLAQGDPGDETARRYRYQHTCAAIFCCLLLDDTQDAAEIFCEHHEDILIKHCDGTFTGDQVKTRGSGQPVWKADDDQVRMAFARFAKLEAKYPGRFRAYRFLTNHPVYVAENAKSMGYVLAEIINAPAIESLPSSVERWLRRVAQGAGTSELVSFEAMKKATVTDELPKLRDASMRLIHSLTTSWSGAADCSLGSVARAAQALIDECSAASALDHEQVLPTYIAAVHQPAAEIAACINGKRMTADRVRAVLDEAMSTTAALAGPSENQLEPGQGSSELLLKKLDAGGFSAVSQNSAEDLRDKADYLGIVWTKKIGRTKGLERYEHVRSLALADASRAFDATMIDGQRFGPVMREQLRLYIQQRRANGEQLFDCTNEHLEGFAYSLTAQCKVQWSTDRPWEEDS